MERLTERKRNFNGTAISKKSMIDREGYPTVSDYASKVLTKLADYEDAEEQGLLLRLPCKEAYSKIGYEMYIICDRDIKKSEHLGLFVYPNGKMIIMGDKNMNYADIEVDEIGKTVFFTSEEAEAKLAEMEGAE